jgi:hypothetical protein
MMVMLSIILVLVMVPRIYGSWLQFREYAENGDMDRLASLQALHNEWVIRHLSMALVAFGFVAAMKYLPELTVYSETASATAVCSIICFTFAFVESLMAQKISDYATSILQPAKQPKKDHRFQ